MAVRVANLVLGLDETESLLPQKAAERLGVSPEAIAQWRIARRALDARHRRARFVYALDISLSDPSQESSAIARHCAQQIDIPKAALPIPGGEEVRGRVVVVGCGPAGLFAALKLAACGYRPLLLERGAPVEERHKDVDAFLDRRELNANSNLLFGAGGAGTYSDGKLRTRIRDPRTKEVLEQLVAAGASPDILIDSRPHLGTDRLRGIVSNLCNMLLAHGGEIRWHTKLTQVLTDKGRVHAIATPKDIIETNCLILAVGASARDTFQDLCECGMAMEPKPFQMGLRVEHPRDLIDRAVFGELAGHPRLGAAEYVLSAQGVTSFCVCPGGVVLAACAEAGTVCTNGMSVSARDSGFTNAALVATVRPEEFGNDPLSGLAFQRRWERAAFQLAGGDYAAPGQNVPDFLGGSLRALARQTTYPFEVRPVSMKQVLPHSVGQRVAAALTEFERRIPGFASDTGILIGPETRCSCPVRVIRDPTRRVSVSADGVYPAGEGSGYASGIMSSAVDGLKSAEAVISRFAVPQR